MALFTIIELAKKERKMKLIDTHSHLFLEEFDADREEVMQRAKEAGVEKILLPNIDVTTIDALLQCCVTYPDICFPMMGLHPTSVDENYKEVLKMIRQQLDSRDDYVAIGEVGMDLYWDKTYKEAQKNVFETQVQWSIEKQLPLSIHCRSAFDEVEAILKPYKNEARGVFHCFSGDLDEAKRMLAYEGFLLGINGVVTFKKSILQQTLLDVPLNRLVIETDCPYLAPVPFRGKRNESAYVCYVLQKIAEIHQKEVEEVSSIIIQNTNRLFF